MVHNLLQIYTEDERYKLKEREPKTLSLMSKMSEVEGTDGGEVYIFYVVYLNFVFVQLL